MGRGRGRRRGGASGEGGSEKFAGRCDASATLGLFSPSLCSSLGLIRTGGEGTGERQHFVPVALTWKALYEYSFLLLRLRIADVFKAATKQLPPLLRARNRSVNIA